MNPRRVPQGLLALTLTLFGSAGLLAQEAEAEYPHGDFDGDCTMCHSPDSWTPAVVGAGFSHATTGFALAASHRQTTCRACHLSLDFSATPSSCAGCHVDIHESELGMDCGNCHTSRSFIDRTRMIRSHQMTRFPLRGAHRTLDCEDCHQPDSPGGLQWAKVAVECRDCHLAEYQATMNPIHQTAGFPETCDVCHSTLAWEPAGLNHDGPFFPIYSGEHLGKWNDCSDCHVVPNNFTQFSCIDCHEHDDPIDLANKHDDEGGYEYTSQACYNCHPRGDE